MSLDEFEKWFKTGYSFKMGAKSKPQKGDILACWDNSFISKTIRYITKSHASHIAIIYDETLVIESWWTGVRLVKLENLKNRTNFYGLRYDNLTKNQAENIIKYLQNSYESKYDKIQLITIALHKLFGFKIRHNDKKYICSELAWEAYNSAGIDIAPQVDESIDVVPGDLLNSQTLRTVYLEFNSIIK